VVSIYFFVLWKNQKKCRVCGSNHIHKKGIRLGKQRFQCADCGASFTIKNDGVKNANSFIWFYKWVIERQIYQTLSRDSKKSQSTLQRLFKSYLQTAPIVKIKSKSKVHLLIDGTYFSNGLCLILYYDHDIRYVQLFRRVHPMKYHENVVVFGDKTITYNPQMVTGKPYKTTVKKIGKMGSNKDTSILKDTRKVGQVFINKGTRFPSTILEFQGEGKPIHPTQKPISLFEYLIKTYSNEGDVILDNTAGLFTTSIAALNTNRNFICIEKDDTWFNLGKERIEKHFIFLDNLNNQKLF